MVHGFKSEKRSPPTLYTAEFKQLAPHEGRPAMAELVPGAVSVLDSQQNGCNARHWEDALVKTKSLLLLNASILMIWLVSFSTVAFAQKVNVEFDETADFTHYKTFAIRKGELNSRNPALNSELVKKQIEADIARDLASRGLSRVESGPADLNVFYHFGSARKTEVEAYPAGWRGWGTRYVRVPYAEGTLVIDLRDTTTHSLVWRGISSEAKNDASKIQGKLDDMVKKSIEKYPPKKK
jgi:hypothetical protein